MRVFLLTTLAGLLLAAPQQSQTQMPMQMDMPMMMMQNCPMNMAGTDIAVNDTPDGVAITLTPKDLAKLEEFRAAVRQRVEHMKNMKSGSMTPKHGRN